MIKKSAILLLLLSVLITAGINAQNISNEQFPSSIKWKKIETNSCILIFPENLEEKARSIAATIDSYYPPVEASLDTEVSRWPVIINNSLVYTNGYVLGAPSHSQLYTIYPQQGLSGAADWLPFLWSHELRHIVQNEKMIRGFTAFAEWLAGEYGVDGMRAFSIPRWVNEGDAVLTETLLGSGGRGRIAGFDLDLRTNELSGLRYDYPKSAQGYYASYVSRVPSVYVTGYHLCTYIRKEYGLEAFNRILEISADYSFVPLILNIAVKKVTGISIGTLYSNCLDELEELWTGQLDGREITDAEIIKSAEIKDYTSYYPLGEFSNNPGSKALLKSSASAGLELLRLDQDGEEHLLRKINPVDLNISFNGESFCWVESRPDIRWGNRSWSVLRLYNPDRGIYRLLTDKTRYLSPSLSPDGRYIAAVEITEELDTFIVVMDAETGRPVSRTAEPEGAAPSQTCWNDDGTAVVYVRQGNWMKSLRILYPKTGENKAITEPAEYNISSPSVSGGAVYYVSDETGIECIHRAYIDLENQQGELLVSRTFGTAAPVLSGNRLYFADYSASGYAAAAADPNPEVLPEISSPGHVDFFSGLEEQEPFANFAGPDKAPWTDIPADSAYYISDYNPAAGLFNFHSRTLGISSSGTGITVGLKADSIMNDSSSTVYAGFDSDNLEILSGVNGAYAGFFPVLLYGIELQTPATAPGTLLDSVMHGGIWLPLNFSKGIISQTLSLQSVFLMENRVLPYFTAAAALRTSASYRLNKTGAKRDLIPPLGMALSGYWYKSLDMNLYNFIFGETVFYLPGIAENQGIQLTLQADYNFSSADRNFEAEQLPRGISLPGFSPPLMFNSSIDYLIPMFYPDMSIGSLLYIPRVFMKCFLDTAYVPETQLFLQTTGIGFYTDYHIFNHYYPFRAGIRIIYNTMNGHLRLEETSLSIGIELL